MGDCDCGDCDCGSCDCDCGNCDCDNCWDDCCSDCCDDCCDCCDLRGGCCSCKCGEDCGNICCCMTCTGCLDDICGDTCCGNCCDQLFRSSRPTNTQLGGTTTVNTQPRQRRPPQGFPEPGANGYVARDLDVPPPSYDEVISSEPHSDRYGEVIMSQPEFSALPNSQI